MYGGVRVIIKPEWNVNEEIGLKVIEKFKVIIKPEWNVNTGGVNAIRKIV